jgi:hypothetical protein
MPYSVWLTSHRRYEDVRAGAPDRLTPEELRACLDLLARSRPILRARRPDGATWVFRADAEPASAPLLWAGVRPNNGPRAGTLQLSVSGTSASFLANMFELLSLAAIVNEELGLRVFEGVHGREVTVESLGALTEAQGKYAMEQGRQWLQRREQLHTTIHMPLEFPAGGHDEGPNLLALRLKHPKPPPLAELLKAPPEGQDVELQGNQGVWFDRASGEPVTWFLRNPHAADELLIWPQWGEAAFVQTARTTFAAAELLRTRAGGQVLWNGEPATPERTDWLRRYPELLGVELLQLVTAGWEPTVRQP